MGRNIEMLSGDPQCSYDQWVVLAGKKMCGKNYRIEANKKVKGAKCLVDKCGESDRRTKLKFAKINTLPSSSSPSLLFRIPADPRAPEAFTLNMTTRNKSKRRCLTQSGCVLLSFLISSTVFLTILLIYLSQATQVMTSGMPDQ